VGSMLFGHINAFLWGDVSIAMLTLFRISTFESWTSIMYETMAVYPLSWMFYLSFIFLTTFTFLNMMVGTVLDVMSEESRLMSEAKLQLAIEQQGILTTENVGSITAPNGLEQTSERVADNENRPATAAEIKQLHAKIDQLTALLLQQQNTQRQP